MIRKPSPTAAVELRVEIQTQREWVTAKTSALSLDRVVVSCTQAIEIGAPMNMLLYVPKVDDVDLIKVHGKATRCDDEQGLFKVEASLEVFAPGDERRYKLWFNQGRGAKPTLTPGRQLRRPRVA